MKQLLLCLMMLPALTRADINRDLHGFFDRLGFDSNTSMPQVWQGQAAGYASGGSLFMRTGTRQIQMMSMTLPSLTSGCGGIDAYLGSFSHINSEQMVRFSKQIMSNAAGYLTDLAIQTAAPELKQAKDYLQKLAADMNSTNLTSCQAAQGIIGGLWPETQVASQKVCQDIAGESNLFADWAASRQGCTVGGRQKSVLDSAGPQHQDRVLTERNLMWNALGKNSLFSGNRELREFAMSLTGTLIFDAAGEVRPLMPLAGSEDLIRAMMNGGTAKIYGCDSADKCLNPLQKEVTVNAANALNGQVRRILTGIQNKAVSDFALTEAEKGFIASTRVPVLRWLVDPQSLGIASSLIYQLTDYVSYDILLQYLQEMIQQARVMLSSRNYPQAAMQALQDSLSLASQAVAGLQARVQIQQDAMMVVDRQMNYLRQQVSGRLLEQYQANYRFREQ